MKNGVKVVLTVITGVVVFFLSTRFIFVIPSYGGHKAPLTLTKYPCDGCGHGKTV